MLLVPYCNHHVPRYHEWMKDPAIQIATASEPLTLEEEFSMQQSWRADPDKLTFIICTPIRDEPLPTSIKAGTADSKSQMIGDVNLFISIDEDKLDASQIIILGELELMVAESKHQHMGYGRSALLTFLQYILKHEREILTEFLRRHTEFETHHIRLSSFGAKIRKDNISSLSLFEKLGFEKTSEQPNYFDEFEVRHDSLNMKTVEKEMRLHFVNEYQEIEYH